MLTQQLIEETLLSYNTYKRGGKVQYVHKAIIALLDEPDIVGSYMYGLNKESTRLRYRILNLFLDGNDLDILTGHPEVKRNGIDRQTLKAWLYGTEDSHGLVSYVFNEFWKMNARDCPMCGDRPSLKHKPYTGMKVTGTACGEDNCIYKQRYAKGLDNE